MTRRQKAKASLSLALKFLHESEAKAAHHARMLALVKKELGIHRANLRLCTADARKAGVL